MIRFILSKTIKLRLIYTTTLSLIVFLYFIFFSYFVCLVILFSPSLFSFSLSLTHFKRDFREERHFEKKTGKIKRLNRFFLFYSYLIKKD